MLGASLSIRRLRPGERDGNWGVRAEDHLSKHVKAGLQPVHVPRGGCGDGDDRVEVASREVLRRVDCTSISVEHQRREQYILELQHQPVAAGSEGRIGSF